VKGLLTITYSRDTQRTSFKGLLSGLSSSNAHGFHIHEKKSLADGCKGAGGHFNPAGHPHAGPGAEARHVGDLGNIAVGEQDVAEVAIEDHQTRLEGEHSVLGRPIVIHAGEDDLGLGDYADSTATGHAGARVACCLIE